MSVAGIPACEGYRRALLLILIFLSPGGTFGLLPRAKERII